jgi:thioredoxin-dependent adenylylsulfate APS reductase
MDRHESQTAPELLAWALSAFGRDFAIATSFQKEGMVLADMAWRIDPRVRLFTLDTGRLPQETHAMIETVRERYGLAVEVVLPDPAEVAAMVAEGGADLFYRSVEARTLCCEVRKVRPLARKLRTLAAWATGLRRGQSPARASIPKVEEDSGTVKLNPLADWSAAQVDDYIAANGVPVHPLYARGYASIGCAPCTRAVAPGEDQRAGRWWWEHESAKECGIHFSPDGQVERRRVSRA